MAEVVNLRRARKVRARQEKDAKAQENRVVFGRSKTERSLSAAKTQLDERRLDAHKRDVADDPA
jgi:hypothetical protein